VAKHTTRCMSAWLHAARCRFTLCGKCAAASCWQIAWRGCCGSLSCAFNG
jgi:hypothetical protein